SVGTARCVTPRNTCPQPNVFGHNLNLKTRWFTGFYSSYQVSYFSTFFIDVRAEISVARVIFVSKEAQALLCTMRTGRERQDINLVFLGAFRAR
ncbi:hypothetical protein HAX54_003148, partial [Datura stramonium]|nr:hypothetical protein [Datura stramonium]